VKKIDPLAEYPAFALVLDAEALAGVHPPEALLQFLWHAAINRRPRAVPRLFD
jgi:hypothetical protein